DANHTAARTSQGIPVAKSAIAPTAISLAQTTVMPIAPVTKKTSASVSSAKLTAIPAAKPAIPDFDQAKFQKVREKWQRRLENEERRLRIISGLSTDDLDPDNLENRLILSTMNDDIGQFCSTAANQDPKRLARLHPSMREYINQTLKAASLEPANITVHLVKPVSYATKLKAKLGYLPATVDLAVADVVKGAPWCMCAPSSNHDPKRSVLLINHEKFPGSQSLAELKTATLCNASVCLKRSQVYEQLLLHEASHIHQRDSVIRALVAYKTQSPVLYKAWLDFSEKRADFKSILSCANPLGSALLLTSDTATGYEHRRSPECQELCNDIQACFSQEFLAKKLSTTNFFNRTLLDFEKPIEPLLVIEPKDLR
ncbi:MAG TPA: hypothetical protein VJJ83_00360, partial [Candidatus Babeliales bacterium]|nr:hypothetical protein [Candidatus Babeliales bacterium]